MGPYIITFEREANKWSEIENIYCVSGKVHMETDTV